MSFRYETKPLNTAGFQRSLFACLNQRLVMDTCASLHVTLILHYECACTDISPCTTLNGDRKTSHGGHQIKLLPFGRCTQDMLWCRSCSVIRQCYGATKASCDFPLVGVALLAANCIH